MSLSRFDNRKEAVVVVIVVVIALGGGGGADDDDDDAGCMFEGYPLGSGVQLSALLCMND